GNLPVAWNSTAESDMLLRRLISRGDIIEIRQGLLHISPTSGRNIPDAWWRDNQEDLIAQIAKAVGVPAYRYLSYKVGRFGKGYEGLRIQFVELASDRDLCTFFNVHLNRRRSTRSGAAGSGLPDGHFRVGQRSDLHKFW